MVSLEREPVHRPRCRIRVQRLVSTRIRAGEEKEKEEWMGWMLSARYTLARSAVLTNTHKNKFNKEIKERESTHGQVQPQSNPQTLLFLAPDAGAGERDGQHNV